MITKGERAELRSLIRQRFKVLRAEIEVRRAELEAELDSRIVAKFSNDDKAWGDAMFLVEEAAREANRKANDILRGVIGDAYPKDSDHSIITARTINQPKHERNVLRTQGMSRIAAQVKTANLQLDRQEADLLTRLVAGALESEEARSFLGEIPTVSALVPADRLLELERSLQDGET